jgi:hypothetical protein
MDDNLLHVATSCQITWPLDALFAAVIMTNTVRLLLLTMSVAWMSICKCSNVGCILQAWDAVSLAAGTMDVLSALARFAALADGRVCVPSFQQSSSGPVFEASGLWHPALAACTNTTAVPNDVCLGSRLTGTAGRAMLLTGPNMVRCTHKAACVFVSSF